jgi:hypothetical protein
MPKNQSNPALHPSLFDPTPHQPQWANLPPQIRQQLTPLLIQLLKNHALRKHMRIEKGGAHE